VESHLEHKNLLGLGLDVGLKRTHILTQVADQRLLPLPEAALRLCLSDSTGISTVLISSV